MKTKSVLKQPVLKHLSSFQIIIIGFIVVILLGSICLMLPIASKDRVMTPFLDALFTSTSATCVTGLVVYNTSSHWSVFGQVIILFLIQIGGMGVVTFLVALITLTRRKIGLMQRSTVQEALAAQSMSGVVRLVRFIVKTTLIIELLGAIIMAPIFCKDYGIKGLWLSLFHSVSAFCNAGFDLMGEANSFPSLTSYSTQPLINLVIMALIIIGGIGFLTWEDVYHHGFHIKKYRVQSKMILLATLILILLPSLYFFFFECQRMPMKERIWTSLFQAISPRTAGFNTTDVSLFSETGIFIVIVLMMIGGSPGSTAGGIKTTTICVLVASSLSVFRRKKDTNVLRRRIADETVKNAAAILLMYIILSVTCACIISKIENLPLLDCLYETVSAIATVGLTLGITPSLGAISHILLMILMFVGRIGGLTLIYAAIGIVRQPTYRYPVGKITVG